MTESKQIILSDFKEFFYVFEKEEVKEEPKKLERIIPFTECNIKGDAELIDKKRELKRWKQSISYYSLYPEKFKFSLKDLK